jgi:uncharacterized membrane protein
MDPRLITTFKVTPKGTNGGISPLGIVASAMGGKFMGFCMAIAALFDPKARLIKYSIVRWSALGAVLGLLGSLVTSLSNVSWTLC